VAALLVLLSVGAVSARAQEGRDRTPVELLEARAWRGFVEVDARSREGGPVKGGEHQVERLEFVVLTEPLRNAVVAPQLSFRPREADARWSFTVDRTVGEGTEAEILKGENADRLHATVRGFVQPTVGRYALAVSVLPDKLVIPCTLTGFKDGLPATYRSVLERRPFLLDFSAEGECEDGGRRMRGERTLLDSSEPHERDVTIRWEITRVDPVLAGLLTGPGGMPLEGVKVLARTTNPGRVRQGIPPLLREATTDADGRFEIPASFAIWSLEVVGYVENGLIHEGFFASEVALRLEEVPRFDRELNVYRLADLPRAGQLDGYFRGDVGRYLSWLRARVPEATMEAARVLPEPPDGEKPGVRPPDPD